MVRAELLDLGAENGDLAAVIVIKRTSIDLSFPRRPPPNNRENELSNVISYL